MQEVEYKDMLVCVCKWAEMCRRGCVHEFVWTGSGVFVCMHEYMYECVYFMCMDQTGHGELRRQCVCLRMGEGMQMRMSKIHPDVVFWGGLRVSDINLMQSVKGYPNWGGSSHTPWWMPCCHTLGMTQLS